MQYSIAIHAEDKNLCNYNNGGPFYRLDEIKLQLKDKEKFNLFIINDQGNEHNSSTTISSKLVLILFLTEEDLNLIEMEMGSYKSIIILEMLPNLYAVVSDENSIMELSKILLKISSSNLIHEQIQIDSVYFVLPKSNTSVILPNCPICISRIDKTLTGLNTLRCRDLFHPCCQKTHRNTCLGCRTCEILFSSKKELEKCSDCDSNENIWICLICANFGCGRYKNGHARNHFIKCGHSFSLNLNSYRIWDYSTDRYVHWKIVSAEGAVEVTEEISDILNYSSSINGFESEGTFLNDFTTAQLESQKDYFDERLRTIQISYKLELSKLEGKHNEQIIKLNSELNHFNTEKKVLTELKSQLQDTNKKLKNKCHNLTDELETERRISHGLAKTVDNLNCRLDAAKVELKDFEDQVKDLMKHIEVLDLMAKAGNDPDIVEGKLLIRPSAGGGSNRSVNKKKVK